MNRHLIVSTVCLFMGALAMAAQTFGPLEHHYTVNWKWGIINMNAAQARVNVSCNDGRLTGTLAGHSVPWEGRVYTVTDTLRADVKPDSQSIGYVNGWYRKPRVNKSMLPQNPKSYLTIQGQGELDGSAATMEAVAVTANMLSMFYYARCIDFGSLKAGEVIDIPITGEGNAPDSLRIIYNGLDDDGYSVTFTYDISGAPDSYKVDCLINPVTRLPEMFSSNIRIGHVSMTLEK